MLFPRASVSIYIKRRSEAGHQWFMHVILAIQKAEIRRIMV
jgi:hypothetical protein